MVDPAHRKATYEDVLAAPPHKVAEVIDGELYLHPRPAGPQCAAAAAIGEELGPPFKRGKGGPGGWIILDEPELHLGPDIVVPDLGGWRRTTMDQMPNAPYLEVRPDWVCEVLSPSTERLDRIRKFHVYRIQGVGHLWFVNPLQRFIEVYRLEREHWVQVGTHADAEVVRLEPFDAIELDLSILWADVRL